MNIEINKIAAAILGAGVFSMGLGLLSEAIFKTEKPEKPGFVIATADASAPAAAEEKPAAVAPIADRLKEATAEAGKKVFAKCTACHNADEGGKNSTGPNLWNVVGAVSGTHDGFSYSPAMLERNKAGAKWSFEDLDQFLTKPAAYVPKTKMGFEGLPKPADRAAVIMYLRGQSKEPVALP